MILIKFYEDFDNFFGPCVCKQNHANYKTDKSRDIMYKVLNSTWKGYQAKNSNGQG